MNNEKRRDIQKIWTVQERTISNIHRAGAILEPGNWQAYDPFLLLMEDKFQKGAFDRHPHRGIETITFVIDGSINHYDSATGEGGKLQKGDMQLMTAGRGVIHNESPDNGDKVHLLQLWVNLPRKDKMTAPRYQNIQGKDVPVRKEEGAKIRVYSGSSGDVMSETLNYVPVTFVEMLVDQGATVSQDLPGDYNGYIYVLEGSGTFGENKIVAKKGQAMWLGSADEADKSFIQVHANEKLRIILFAGPPLKEPIVAQGPFVMNTMEEIKQAYEDYRNGTFIL
ncbi:redox-sensitive bicupin YhaK (pirin superfamily) [Neobacillus niacini]|uniref:pirin family protein n=1 Tax=Neobacillus niacini TaxID=86668 RepID=UPI00285BC5DD|nr:pirin family protein [Neobacillus niacini]MDR7078121.1 redox-sensitive bicupin YhaK (pirin superfamily) [Neobacillus niacini]